jgi:SulP family sulfate permease
MSERLIEQGGRMLMSGMPSAAGTRGGIERYLSKLGLVHGETGIQVFEHRNAALEWMEDRILAEVGWSEPEDAPPLELPQIELFREMPVAAVESLRQIAEKVSLPKGSRLFRRGDAGDRLFLIRKGVVDVFLPLPGEKRHHLATFGRGDYLGELAFLDQEARSADAEARADCELFAVPRGRFNQFALEHPAVAAMIFARLALLVAKRLRTADAELRIWEER